MDQETRWEMCWDSQQTEKKGSQSSSTEHSTNIQYLENKVDNFRARISFQRDIRDCNIFCLSETWHTTSVLDTAVIPSDNFYVCVCNKEYI